MLRTYTDGPRALKLITVENQETAEKRQRQLENLFQIKQSAATLGVVLDVEFADPQAIHDRSITTDTGWKILLGRGLDIFQRRSDSPFDLATKYQKYRELKGFGITYLRDSVSGGSPVRPVSRKSASRLHGRYCLLQVNEADGAIRGDSGVEVQHDEPRAFGFIHVVVDERDREVGVFVVL